MGWPACRKGSGIARLIHRVKEDTFSGICCDILILYFFCSILDLDVFQPINAGCSVCPWIEP